MHLGKFTTSTGAIAVRPGASFKMAQAGSIDVNTSATSLAVAAVAREKNKPLLLSGPGTTELTGRQCSPNHIHWTWDTYMLARSSGAAVVQRGGASWYFVAADYSFGQQLVKDASSVVEATGGKVLGSTFYPFPTTTDFSSMLVRAKSSGAKTLSANKPLTAPGFGRRSAAI